MSTLTFPDTYNMVSFLEKPAESDGFHEIIDFLNANQIHYALTVNPTIYTSCIEQCWAIAKVKTVNGERQIQALVDKKKVIITETSIRSDLYLKDADGTDCLPTATIFEELAEGGEGGEGGGGRGGLILLVYINAAKLKLMLLSYCCQIWATTKVKTVNEEHQIQALVDKNKVIITETSIRSDLHLEDADEKKAGFKTYNFKRLYKVGVTRRVESSDDESLGAQEDASKQGRSRIKAIDRDTKVTLVETQRRNDKNDDNLMFDTGVFDGDEIVVETEEPVINAATTTKSIPVSTDEIDLAQEITLAQALAAMKSAKPKEKDVVQESSENVSTATTMVSTATTTVVATPAITTPPQQRAKGIAFREPVESTVTTTVPSQKSKDKGKAIMIEPEKPLKKKDQIELDEELAREIEAEEQAELERIQKERAAQEEASRAAIYEEWDNEQAMMEADYELAANLQENEREAMSIEEKSRRLAELIRERKKFFAAQRAEAIRNKPPTKTQRRNQMIQYLKNMAGYSYAQLKDKSFDEVQKLFEKHMKWINSLVPMEEDLPSEKVQKEEGNEKKAEGSSRKKSIDRKRAKDKQEQESSKRQRVEDDKEEEELKKCFELAKEEDVAINAIPLATKVPFIGFQIHTRGKPGYYETFRADGSSKLYHVFSQPLSEFDREDLVNLWKLVQAKHGDNRPDEDFERVLWGDLRVMFEPNVESKVWRSLQGYKRYPLTPITITNMLNKKLQVDQWNEMVYQLLKLMIQKMNIKFRGGLLGLKGFLKLLLLSTAGTKVNAAGLQLLEELLLEDVMIKTKMKNPLLDQTEGRSERDQARKCKSAQEEEHGPRVDDLEELLHQEFNIGNDDVSLVREIIVVDE
ncbi:hypothetical protein Tco_0755114 [Tanacetum coccineum]